LFTSDVSHELRTPLMVLASSCELLLENSGIDQRGRAQVERIARACEEMRELVQTFLMLARAQREDASMAPQQSLAQVADGLLNLWREPIEAKGLSLMFEPGNPDSTCYNSTLLHAVMGNLLRNALHYTEQGFIRLTLTTTGFRVEDSGVGIPEEKREAMFEPFVLGNEKRGEGLGLGLSLVQRICENQGWSVSLTNMEPHGCRFQVELG
jgi:signal transduction histidine kinase